MTISATDLERIIFELEEIRVVIRCNKNTRFGKYPFNRKAKGNTTISGWYNSRLKPIIGECDAEIINGQGVIPHGRISIETIRDSYKK